MGYFSNALEKMDSEQAKAKARAKVRVFREEPAAPPFQRKRERGPETDLERGPLVVLSDPWSYSAEQFRSIKTSIMFPENGGDIRTILVMSAVPGEGKSFVAANIAAVIATSMDNYVLVVDSDLRRPTMADIFSLPPEAPGLDLYLNKKCPLEDVIHHTHVEKLSVIPAGNVVGNPAELIASSTMTDMLAHVRSRYYDRYIIIDSPPPLFAPESIALSKQVDGIVVVVRHDKTMKKTVTEMLGKLDRTKVIGIVLNQYNVPFRNDIGYRGYYANDKKSRK